MAQHATKDVVWVAGVGASAGLGAAVARRFARGGAVVALSSRTPSRLEAVAAEIRAEGGEAVAIATDVSSGERVQASLGEVLKLGTLRAAVFNPSEGERAPSLELSDEAFEHAWRISAFGGFVFGREVLRVLVGEQRGTLLFTGATASLRGKPPFGAFASAKAALRSVAQTFAREFGPKGIHVAHVIIDGGIDGERLRSRNPQRAVDAGADGLLAPDAIAEVYYQLHTQPRSAWTQELDLRPYKETF